MSETNGKPHGPSRIYWIGGSKGGVGKSMMTVVILDYLLEQGEKVLLVECDTSNPDALESLQQRNGRRAHRPGRGRRMDPSGQPVRRRSKPSRRGQHRGAQQRRRESVRPNARDESRRARSEACGVLDDQP